MNSRTVVSMILNRFNIDAYAVGKKSRDRWQFRVYLPADSAVDPDEVKRAVKDLVESRGKVFVGCDVYRGQNFGRPVLVSTASSELFAPTIPSRESGETIKQETG